MTDRPSLFSVPPELAHEAARQLVIDLVAIPSYGENEGPILDYLARRFQRQRIPCRITEVGGKPLNLVAEIGQGARAIVLNSHVDTVPPGNPALWQTDPLTPTEKNGRIYGRGAEDAKGCLAAVIVAFEALAAKREQLPVRVVLMAVGGEERGGVGTRAEIAKGVRADAAIVGESTLLEPKLAHKGVLRLEVEVKGKAAHASDPEAGVNAVVAMAPVISALDRLGAEVRTRQERHTGRASLVISTIAGGVALNVIPASCVISIDRRALPTESEEQVRSEIVRTVAAALPPRLGATAEVRTVRFVAPSATPEGASIVRAGERAASELLGKPVRASGFTATCDMTYLVNGGGIPSIILGPDSIGLAHQVDECVSVEEMTRAVAVYLRTIELWAADQEV